MHESIVHRRIPRAVRERHRMALGEERVLVVASADKLLADAARFRRRHFLLATNGVDLGHFGSVRRSDGPPPPALQGFVGGERPVVGYYGAIAQWFDCALVERLARTRPEWNIVLIGYDYDNSQRQARLDRFANVRVIPAVPYPELPRHAVWFDVAMIPFKVNDITLATSPIKLFEYMAMGLPVVTTALPECRKYRSVRVAETPDEFERLIAAALARRTDPDYRRQLREDAASNSWQSKARAILDAMRAMHQEGAPHGGEKRWAHTVAPPGIRKVSRR
jgi:glycosyltransferase involved in cell wall biosynthesis